MQSSSFALSGAEKCEKNTNLWCFDPWSRQIKVKRTGPLCCCREVNIQFCKLWVSISMVVAMKLKLLSWTNNLNSLSDEWSVWEFGTNVHRIISPETQQRCSELDERLQSAFLIFTIGFWNYFDPRDPRKFKCNPIQFESQFIQYRLSGLAACGKDLTDYELVWSKHG